MPARTTARRTAAVKTALAAGLALASALTLWRPDWIEALGIGDPDHGSGILETVIVLTLAAATVVTTTSAWRQWVRAAATVR
jgi:hypothetical protein